MEFFFQTWEPFNENVTSEEISVTIVLFHPTNGRFLNSIDEAQVYTRFRFVLLRIESS